VRFQVLIVGILEILAVIAMMMEAAHTSEMSVNFYQTAQCDNLEDSHLLW
jgi:hypothetical protein